MALNQQEQWNKLKESDGYGILPQYSLIKNALSGVNLPFNVSYAGMNAPQNPPLVTNNDVKQNQNINNVQQPINNVPQLTLDELRNRNAQLPANYDTTQGRADYLMGTLQKQQPVNNVQQPINSIQQGIKYQNVQPFKTMFDSTGATNQQPANQNAGNPYMDNFKFNQDTFNQGLRDTANQGYQESRDNFLNIARNIKNASISDMMQMAIEGNQYRQDMRKNQADFTNANSLASKNLEQQNDSGLKDLINQRGTFNDQQRLNNDESRLRMEQERLNQQQLQTNTENNYKQDYLNRYLLPQLAQQQANQNAQMQFQRDLNAGNLLDSQNKVQTVGLLDKVDNLSLDARNQAIENLKSLNIPANADVNSMINTETTRLLESNPEYQKTQSQLKTSLLRQSLGQPKNTNTLQGEIEMTDPLSGATIKYKGNQSQIDSIKNSIASAKK